MKEVSFSKLKQESPSDAREFLIDQKVLLIFLNSPARTKWLKFIRLKKEEINKITKIVEYYAKLKVSMEKKKKPKTRKEIIKIEAECLKKVYKGELLKFKSIEEHKIKIAKNIAKAEYPGSIVIDTLKAEKLATLTGLKNKEFPSELLVFDIKNKKIIGLNIINK
ncbi:MAG: hypothetical protein WC413_00595 [Candidatus Nanoarchaeia archaeon]